MQTLQFQEGAKLACFKDPLTIVIPNVLVIIPQGVTRIVPACTWWFKLWSWIRASYDHPLPSCHIRSFWTRSLLGIGTVDLYGKKGKDSFSFSFLSFFYACVFATSLLRDARFGCRGCLQVQILTFFEHYNCNQSTHVTCEDEHNICIFSPSQAWQLKYWSLGIAGGWFWLVSIPLVKSRFGLSCTGQKKNLVIPVGVCSSTSGPTAIRVSYRHANCCQWALSMCASSCISTWYLHFKLANG